MSTTRMSYSKEDTEEAGCEAALPLLRTSLDAGSNPTILAHSTTWTSSFNGRWKGLIICLLLVTLTLLYTQSRLSRSWNGAFGLEQNLCSIEEYNAGSWQHRQSPLATVQDVLDLYKIEAEPISPRDTTCRAPDGSSSEAHLQRLVDVSSYEWKPRSGCSLLQFTRASFLTYLLRAPGGLMIMGDSLTDEHMMSLNNLLVYKNGPVHSKPDHGDWIHSTLHLDISHPDALRILTAAGVPTERATQPLVTFNRDDLFIPHNELDQLYRDIGVTVAADLPAPPAGTEHPDGIYRLSEWASSFPDSLEQIRIAASGNVLFPNDTNLEIDILWPSGIRKEQTVLLISTGSHWNPHIMGMVTESEVVLAYRNMVSKMIPRLQALQPNVLPIWRATSPGHEKCEEAHSPDVRRATLANPDGQRDPDTGHFEHYWDMIETLNMAVKRSIANTRGEVVWIDGYSLAAQRPDAHRIPGKDCMHVCGSVIETEWTKLLWHAVQSRRRN